jgi:hypothetical protein
MKAIKIGLALVVLGLIVFFILKFFQSPPPPPPIGNGPQEKTHYERIQDSIKSIHTLPLYKFNKNKYGELMSLIEQWNKAAPPHHPYGRFGETQSENDLNKNNLTSTLYSVYVQKFIEQTFNVFRGSDWKPEDLKFIREETNALFKSPFLNNPSQVYLKLVEIQSILNKYNEINSFISDCKSFKYDSLSIVNSFPVDKVIAKINQAKTYQVRNLNPYVNNCSRLQQELRDVPNILFQKHVQYLDKKIDDWSGTYEEYNTQQAYSNSIYTPINNEINRLSNEVYNVSDFIEKRDYLRSRWINEGRKAYDKFL